MVELIRQGTESMEAEVGPRPDVMAMCPMAPMCKRMMEKPPSSAWAILAGAVLVGIGLLVLVEPRVLVWLAGAALVTFGMMLFMMASVLRKLGGGLRHDNSTKAAG